MTLDEDDGLFFLFSRILWLIPLPFLKAIPHGLSFPRSESLLVIPPPLPIFDCRDATVSFSTGGFLGSVVSDIKQRFGDLASVRNALRSWLGKFRSFTRSAADSLETLTRILILGLECGKRTEVIPALLTEELGYYRKVTLPAAMAKYKGLAVFTSEVFAFHHGLKRIPDSVVQTLKDRDALDIGASIGDSALMLVDYCRCVYSFDILLDNIAAMNRVLAVNPDQAAKIRLFHLGMSDHVGVGYSSGSGGGAALNTVGARVDITTIDQFAAGKGLKVGMIKADVEGHAFAVAKGARETMLRDRPILAFAVYHSFTEMYNMSNWLMETLPNYHFEWQIMQHADLYFHELNLIGYPLESLGNVSTRPW
jgi:FkbM family methyltransferase